MAGTKIVIFERGSDFKKISNYGGLKKITYSKNIANIFQYRKICR